MRINQVAILVLALTASCAESMDHLAKRLDAFYVTAPPRTACFNGDRAACEQVKATCQQFLADESTCLPPWTRDEKIAEWPDAHLYYRTYSGSERLTCKTRGTLAACDDIIEAAEPYDQVGKAARAHFSLTDVLDVEGALCAKHFGYCVQLRDQGEKLIASELEPPTGFKMLARACDALDTAACQKVADIYSETGTFADDKRKKLGVPYDPAAAARAYTYACEPFGSQRKWEKEQKRRLQSDWAKEIFGELSYEIGSQSPSCFGVARLYEQGRGVPRDARKAAYYDSLYDTVRSADQERQEAERVHDAEVERVEEANRQDEAARRAREDAERAESNAQVIQGAQQAVRTQQAVQQNMQQMRTRVDQTVNAYDASRSASQPTRVSNGGGAATAAPVTSSQSKSGGVDMSDACIATCRRYKSCFDPYNACYGACNNHGNSENGCERDCNTTFRSCKQASGPVCGLQGSPANGCCACSD